MEYALIGLLMIFQDLFNTLLTLEVVDGVPLGGVLLACLIFGVLLQNFNISEGRSSSKNNKK